ncbi:unnamed protein product, partial [marine sediment metagenome]
DMSSSRYSLFELVDGAVGDGDLRSFRTSGGCLSVWNER